MFVDVILPLPLEGLFTYSVPQGWEQRVKPGIRVVAPLGKTKKHIALVREVHNRKPDFECKDILQLLDEQPVVLDLQLRLWQWIADYYMAPLGDVFVAALPGGLKEESYKPKTETYVTLAPQFQNEQALHIALNMLARAPQQQKVWKGMLVRRR